MENLLAGIEQLAIARALKTSFIAYPIVNALHIVSIGVLLTAVMLMDLRIVGAFRSMPVAPFVMLLRRMALTALAGAVVTGLLLFSVWAGEYAAMPVFAVKIMLIVLAGGNFLAFLRVSRNAGDQPGGAAIKVLALLSLALWLSVLLAGRFIGFL